MSLEKQDAAVTTPTKVDVDTVKLLCEQFNITEEVAQKMLKAKERHEKEGGELKLMLGCIDKLTELRKVVIGVVDEYNMVQDFLTKCFERIEGDSELIEAVGENMADLKDNLTEFMKTKGIPK
jgi:hypothetical protein